MAVVQISRIQIRRGLKNSNSGLPQLANGEMAWAVDTQELYIGNGSVTDGAPSVGNTKILTEHDNLIDLFGQYQYARPDPAVVTGADALHPVRLPLQRRLDNTVFSDSFGTVADGIVDDTVYLQRAIDQIFLNPINTSNRTKTILRLPPGTYRITGELYIPSFTAIHGVGMDKTVIIYEGLGSPFKFVNDTATIGEPSLFSTTTYSGQPQFISIKDLSILSVTSINPTLMLDAVRDSEFENISLTGNWSNTVNETHQAIQLNALSTLVTCQRNIFKHVYINGYTYGVFSDDDITSNRFDNCFIKNAQQGVVFGKNTNLGSAIGPYNNNITDCIFEDVKESAVYVYKGYGNTVRDATCTKVGTNGGNITYTAYPHVYFATSGNSYVNNKSDREIALSGASANLTTKYVPEAAGIVSYQSYSTQLVNVINAVTPTLISRFPLDVYGAGYSINYMYQSTNLSISRKGTITVIVDSDTKDVQWTDEYTFSGPTGKDRSLDFTFDVVDSNSDLNLDTIKMLYTNTEAGDIGTLTYSYSVIFHN